jgi:hypothetical protein
LEYRFGNYNSEAAIRWLGIRPNSFDWW